MLGLAKVYVVQLFLQAYSSCMLTVRMRQDKDFS